MVKTVGYYNPPAIVNDDRSSLIRFAFRIVSRQGDVVIDFGEFEDLVSWSDRLSVESPVGSWTLRMKPSQRNDEFMKKLHPGLIIEAYCARNDDPLKGLSRDSDNQVMAPPKPELGEPVFADFNETTGLQISSGWGGDGNPKPPPKASDPDYLDLAPYLLMRGILTGYGYDTSVNSGGAEMSLVLSGESYGRIYTSTNAIVNYAQSPVGIGKSLEIAWQTLSVNSLVILYYGLLRHWVEEFWGEPTGWEARTRPIPIPPYIFSRFQGGSVWGLLDSLCLRGLFFMTVDHTGAILWSKLPWSSDDDALVDEAIGKAPGSGSAQGQDTWNWEDLALYTLESWKIISWGDRLDGSQIRNFVQVVKNLHGGSGGRQAAGQPALVYNQGSIAQYGGPILLEISIPTGTGPELPEGDSKRVEIEDAITTLQDLIALETIGWYDRPVQRVVAQVRGEAAWRIHTRMEITENWHYPEADTGEYYVEAREHQINFVNAGWTTTLSLVRDRRTRYLGIGTKEQSSVPIELDSYWMWKWQTGKTENIGNSAIEYGKQS